MRRLEKLSAQSPPVNQAPAAAAASEPEPERGRKKTITLPITRCVARDTATTSEPVSPPNVFPGLLFTRGRVLLGTCTPGQSGRPQNILEESKK